MHAVDIATAIAVFIDDSKDLHMFALAIRCDGHWPYLIGRVRHMIVKLKSDIFVRCWKEPYLEILQRAAANVSPRNVHQIMHVVMYHRRDWKFMSTILRENLMNLADQGEAWPIEKDLCKWHSETPIDLCPQVLTYSKHLV